MYASKACVGGGLVKIELHSFAIRTPRERLGSAGRHLEIINLRDFHEGVQSLGAGGRGVRKRGQKATGHYNRGGGRLYPDGQWDEKSL